VKKIILILIFTIPAKIIFSQEAGKNFTFDAYLFDSIRCTVLDLSYLDYLKETSVKLGIKTDSCTRMFIDTALILKIEPAIINKFDSLNELNTVPFIINHYNRQYIGSISCTGDSLVYILFCHDTRSAKEYTISRDNEIYKWHFYPPPTRDFYGVYWFVMVYELRSNRITKLFNSQRW